MQRLTSQQFAQNLNDKQKNNLYYGVFDRNRQAMAFGGKTNMKSFY